MKEMITRNFETASGYEVEVTGKLIEFDNYVKTKMDVMVKGIGSQGGSVSIGSFTHNGTDYAAVIGKLPLTEGQLEIIFEVTRELMEAKENHPLTLAQNDYGTYEEVENKHSWMKGTY